MLPPDTQSVRWHYFDTTTGLETATAQTLLSAARSAIAERGAFHVVLAGGTTPRGVYCLLRDADADWSVWHIWYGDERCLPPDDPERNSRMAADTWLDHVAIPRAQIHAIPAERGARNAAAAYADALQAVGEFDLVLLGLGEDGHTASLFPGHDLGMDADAPAAIAVFNAPKPPPERVSLSARRLNQSRQVLFLVAGASKQDALKHWQDGAAIPAAVIAPEQGQTSIFIAT